MDSGALRQIFALANAFKEGDLAVGGTRDDRVREDARQTLRAVTVGEIRRTAFVEDDVTAALDRSRDRRFDGDLDPLTIAQLKGTLLGPGGPAWGRRHRDALTSEAVAAAVKIMTSDELSLIARTLFNPHEGEGVPLWDPRWLATRQRGRRGRCLPERWTLVAATVSRA